jgi:predicted nucleotidyltransferase
METPRLPHSIRRVVGRYVRAFAPERIVLFGSQAKGTNRPESDLDVLIIMGVEGDDAMRLRRARQLAIGCFPPVDVIFATTGEVEHSTIDGNPFLVSILGTGITLYERGVQIGLRNGGMSRDPTSRPDRPG